MDPNLKNILGFEPSTLKTRLITYTMAFGLGCLGNSSLEVEECP